MSNAIDLTWLSAVKRRAEVTSTNDDQDIQDAITAFSQYVLDYTGQVTLNSIGMYNETYNGNGNQRMFLRNYPIQSLISVIANGVQFPLSTGFNVWGAFIEQSQKSIAMRGGTGNFFSFPYPNSFYGPLGGASPKGPVFFRGVGNINVQYTAGYSPTTITNEIDTVVNNSVTLQTGPWASDGGVMYYPTLVPLVQVANTPAQGQYAVVSGLYVFNSADNGQQIAVTYSINRAPFDLEYAVRCVVAINYKRKAWQDLLSRSVAAGGTTGTTRYGDKPWPEEYEKVFFNYKRLSPS